MTRAIMLQGTGSDVGKTVLVAGLCRLARRRGLRVAPFKPQNMSNNAAVAADGAGGEGEIGRAQWLQALACGLEPSVDMNPVLLKPEGGNGSQIVLRGKVAGRATARDYQQLKPRFLQTVRESFAALARRSDLVLVEGAGSPAEVNLRANDIANMGFARAANVPVALVGDIDRGGVIASLVGTGAVLEPDDAAMIGGYLINKFRGDVSLFDDGLAFVTARTGWPSFGVIPWLDEAGRLPAEDSVALERLVAESRGGRPVVAVLALPRVANFDDLDPLRAEAGIELRFVRAGERVPEEAAAIVLPGSKATLSDLAALRREGWDRQVARAHERGAHVVGICGGYQMLGRWVRDPLGVEGGGEAPGLGLLDVETVMGEAKTVANREATSPSFAASARGYEIHMGVTTGADAGRPVLMIDGVPDGAMSADGRVWGSYLHGLFEAGGFRRAFLATIGATAGGSDHREAVEDALDAIAARLERLVDFDAMMRLAASRTLTI